MPLQSTPEGKWVLYHAATGQRITRWPVDGRDMIACGEYSGDTPDETALAAARVAAETAAELARDGEASEDGAAPSARKSRAKKTG